MTRLSDPAIADALRAHFTPTPVLVVQCTQASDAGEIEDMWVFACLPRWAQNARGDETLTHVTKVIERSSDGGPSVAGEVLARFPDVAVTQEGFLERRATGGALLGTFFIPTIGRRIADALHEDVAMDLERENAIGDRLATDGHWVELVDTVWLAGNTRSIRTCWVHAETPQRALRALAHTNRANWAAFALHSSAERQERSRRSAALRGCIDPDRECTGYAGWPWGERCENLVAREDAAGACVNGSVRLHAGGPTSTQFELLQLAARVARGMQVPVVYTAHAQLDPRKRILLEQGPTARLSIHVTVEAELVDEVSPTPSTRFALRGNRTRWATPSTATRADALRRIIHSLRVWLGERLWVATSGLLIVLMDEAPRPEGDLPAVIHVEGAGAWTVDTIDRRAYSTSLQLTRATS